MEEEIEIEENETGIEISKTETLEKSAEIEKMTIEKESARRKTTKKHNL